MSPRDRELWFQVQRRAAGLSPDLARDLLRAYEIIRESLSDAEMARLIASGQIDQIVDDALLDRAFGPFREKVIDAIEAGFKANTRNLPQRELGRVAFDVLNPRVIDAVRTLDSRVMNTLKEDVRDVVRAHAENALREGQAPKSIVADIRPLVGLTPEQFRHRNAYRDKLLALVKKPLTDQQVERKVAAYERRIVGNNARTTARTVALDSQKLGQRLSWDDAIRKGIVNPVDMVERWVTVGDDRVRPEHVAMNGEEKPYNGTYSNGDTIPGEGEFNCRCISRVIIKREPKAKAA